MSIGPAASRSRLGRDERRELLLDVAVAIAEERSLDDVTMEAVAERAGVSRPLLYKHFANRDELLGAMYRREAANLHERLAARVAAATTLEGMFDALMSGALEASAERGPIFSALRSAGGWTREVRREQRSRDSTTSRTFATIARREGLDPRRAAPATTMLLSLVDSVVAQWRAKPTRERADLLHETYMTVVRATLAALRT
jgi:AcrR family transcriptional regulator